MDQALGSWVILRESRHGANRYVGTGKIASLTPDPQQEGHFPACRTPGSCLAFPSVVPRTNPDSGTRSELRLPASGGSRLGA